ncbi:glycosyltransferase family 1 protein [Cryobacterium sp. TMT1-19]|uniref:glycosyltransferase family 4 protein n=1 Tax=Cryobacterium sp. TMT1-19 TaxID=1259231 RepID=UPI00106CC5D2|nr:glycosyltransferase family 4 protein [Cryobacterium sp. TMT1-19]TFD37922.1 glycosyltransferase family 1 protein [Cryobacterium sp. TMT1-19]
MSADLVGERVVIQRSPETARRRRILIGVTIDDSLQFHTGLPEALVDDGWDVHIVAGRGRRSDGLRDIRGVTVHPLEMRRTPNPSSDLVSFTRWIHLMMVIRPDVTFIGTPKAALLGNVAARIMRVKRRIYVLHGLRLETSTGLSLRMLRIVERLTARSAHETLSVSKSLEALAVRTGMVSKKSAIVLGGGSCNGVDIARFAAVSSDEERISALALEIGLDRSLPTVGFVGRLTRDKGLPELAGAFALLHAEGLAVQVLIVGGIDDESGRVALAELNRTGQKVIAVGYRTDTALFYPLMDVFCLPSHREGLPNVLLEAMASRVVVVGTNVTGIVDLLEDQVTGYLVDRGSERQLADALRDAIQNPSHAVELADAAFKFVKTEFDTRRVQALIREYLTSR